MLPVSLVIPNEASNGSANRDLGQRGASAAGSGFELLHPIKFRMLARRISRVPLRDFETGTGSLTPRCPRSFLPLALLASVGMTRKNEASFLKARARTLSKPVMFRAMLVIGPREIDKGLCGQLPMYVPLRSTSSYSGESFWPMSR